MEDTPHPHPLTPTKPDLLLSQTKKTMVFTYGIMATFVICFLFILISDPSGQSSSSSSSLWSFKDVFHISHFFPNPTNSPAPTSQNTSSVLGLPPNLANVTQPARKSNGIVSSRDQHNTSNTNTSANVNVNANVNVSADSDGSQLYDYESMLKCDLFDGKWVRDDSYPLYPHGSCPHIDEPFDCYLNRRPDSGYESYRWQPNHCNIPRLKGSEMLELIRGKRLVFVGDSLNRNMWESLVCVLRNSVEDKSRVFEASGKHEFRTEGSYAFLFRDYNCSVEFFRSPFLVQEWETPNRDGSKNETLRLDLVERSSDRYKDADILIFNSGHWWTHQKTASGQNYYQEGSHVYGALNVVEAYRRAMTTWGRWVDANVNPMKTQVFFRGYSATHFRGGEWNSGGRCEKETEPFKNEKYLLDYPVKMKMFESVMFGMKTPIYYLNITRLTDYRKEAHPSVYRAQHLSAEERLVPVRYQDCSHWCLPGVPDTWNEIVYAQLLINHYKKHKQKITT